MIFTGRPARSAAMPVLFLLSGPKMGFSPRRGDTLPDKREIWHGGAYQISRLSGQKCGNIAPKLSKFRILTRNLYLRGDSFAIFLRNSHRLYASIGIAFKFLVWSLSRDKHPRYKHFPAVRAFSHKFSIASRGKTTDRIKSSYRGAKMGRTSSITTPSTVGIVGRVPAVDQIVWCFFCLFVF